MGRRGSFPNFFYEDSMQTVAQYLGAVDEGLKLIKFIRFKVGEERTGKGRRDSTPAAFGVSMVQSRSSSSTEVLKNWARN